jgi:serine kinase of HPr protein (carbohydrate metabolism regulator)
MVTLEDIFRDRLSFLGIRHILEPQGLKKPFSGLPIKCSRRIRLAHHQEGAIIILSCRAKEELLALSDPLSREFFANLIFCKTALLIFAQSMIWPVSLKKRLKQHHLPAVISSLHENLLESRIKAILQEKINKRVTVHGVALEIQGRGILITGASGIGKTTAALQVMSEGYAWIADDLTVIKKNQSGQLMISGHRKIKKYFHTGETGIIAVDRVLNAAQIKTRTALSAVIDVIRTDADDVFTQLIEKNILETRLPCLRIGIPRAGYFDKNLLKWATQKLKEVR